MEDLRPLPSGIPRLPEADSARTDALVEAIRCTMRTKGSRVSPIRSFRSGLCPSEPVFIGTRRIAGIEQLASKCGGSVALPRCASTVRPDGAHRVMRTPGIIADAASQGVDLAWRDNALAERVHADIPIRRRRRCGRADNSLPCRSRHSSCTPRRGQRPSRKCRLLRDARTEHCSCTWTRSRRRPSTSTLLGNPSHRSTRRTDAKSDHTSALGSRCS
jgi:hypothetical protein